MKMLFFSILFSFGSAVAQPTSIAGITPGKTSIEELRNLAEPNVPISKKIEEGTSFVRIKALDKSALVKTKNGVVYWLNIFTKADDDLLKVLNSKYGKPQKVVGEISKVICQNKFGAREERVEGVRFEFWPSKDGVQALIEWRAGECDYSATPSYTLYDINIFNGEEIKRKHQEDKIKDEKLNRIKDLL
jgi:hypothetical protein